MLQNLAYSIIINVKLIHLDILAALAIIFQKLLRKCNFCDSDHLRYSLFEGIVSSISWPLVLLVKDPSSSLVQALQLLILSVLQHLCHVS